MSVISRNLFVNACKSTKCIANDDDLSNCKFKKPKDCREGSSTKVVVDNIVRNIGNCFPSGENEKQRVSRFLVF